MSNDKYTSEIPYGYCHCGCGQKTEICTRSRHGNIKGEPCKYVVGHRKNNLSIEQRFWSKVNKNGSIPTHCPELGACWEWTAGKRRGYGAFDYHGDLVASHRVSWELTNGDIPDGLFVCHHCDNHACVNPSHLFLGTHLDNMKDRNTKNRQAKNGGEKSGRRKLSLEQVRYIRLRYAQGDISQHALGKEMGVTQGMIGFILRGENWKD